ncbi:MAG: glycoside hydrolase family 43 protein [Anaerolineales bacterium]
MKTSEIQIRDPFIFPHQEEKVYYLFGTTDKNCWKGPGQGFDCYKSEDLNHWEGPFPAFRPPAHFWGKENFWAPEVHFVNGRYSMFATFIAPQRYRGTHILVSEQVSGPYVPLQAEPITPPDWQCLDGTLFLEADGSPWMVFCHEWVQVHNGAVYAMPLTTDLRKRAGRPVFLFNASEAPWVHPYKLPHQDSRFRFPTYVTDGPFLHRLNNGTLLMLWSSFGTQGYAMGLARSDTGLITGPWHHAPDPLWAADGGHGMIFRTFDGQLMLTFHRPNNTPDERPVFIELDETDDTLCLKGIQ